MKSKIKKHSILLILVLMIVVTANSQISVSLSGDWPQKGDPVLIGWNGLDTIQFEYKDFSGTRIFTLNDEYKDLLVTISVINSSQTPIYTQSILNDGNHCSIEINSQQYNYKANFSNCSINLEYHEAISYIDSLYNRIRALREIVSIYPYKTSEFFKKSMSELNENMENIDKFYSETLIKKSPAIIKYLNARRIYIPSINDSQLEQLANSYSRFFDNKNPGEEYIQKSELYFSNLKDYLGLIMEYASIHENPDSLLISSIDNFLYYIVENDELFKTTTKYFWDYFYKNAQEAIVQHLDQTYLTDQCEGDIEKDLEERLETYQRLAPGKDAPEIIWLSGKNINMLSQIKASLVVLVFWSSGCHHCMISLPEINKELMSYDDIKVIAIGLDNNESEWGNAIKKMPGWIHLMAKERWESAWVMDYGIRAIPSFILLDAEKKIIGKSPDSSGLLRLINQQVK